MSGDSGAQTIIKLTRRLLAGGKQSSKIRRAIPASWKGKMTVSQSQIITSYCGVI